MVSSSSQLSGPVDCCGELISPSECIGMSSSPFDPQENFRYLHGWLLPISLVRSCWACWTSIGLDGWSKQWEHGLRSPALIQIRKNLDGRGIYRLWAWEKAFSYDWHYFIGLVEPLANRSPFVCRYRNRRGALDKRGRTSIIIRSRPFPRVILVRVVCIIVSGPR